MQLWIYLWHQTTTLFLHFSTGIMLQEFVLSSWYYFKMKCVQVTLLNVTKDKQDFFFWFSFSSPATCLSASLQALCQQHRRFILSPCPWLRHRSLLSNSAGQMNHEWMRKLNLMPKQGLRHARLRFIPISTCLFLHCLFQHFAMNSVIHLPGRKCLSLSFIFKPQLGSVHNEWVSAPRQAQRRETNTKVGLLGSHTMHTVIARRETNHVVFCLFFCLIHALMRATTLCSFRSDILSLLRTYNCYHEGKNFQLRTREVRQRTDGKQKFYRQFTVAARCVWPCLVTGRAALKIWPHT